MTQTRSGLGGKTRDFLVRIKNLTAKTPEINELSHNITPFALVANAGSYNVNAQVTPALVAVRNNNTLPSYENLSEDERIQIATLTAQNPIKGLWKSLSHLTKAHNIYDYTGGFLFLPLINILQIALLTILEFGFRTVGAVFLQPGKKLNEWINDRDINPVAKIAAKIFGFIITSPLSCVGQMLTLAGDVMAYSRQFIDSAIRLINPVWWGAKVYECITGKKTNTPSLKIVGTTFVSSILKLMPTAAIITAGVLTSGVAISATAGWSWIGATTAGLYLSGAAAMASKFISGIVNGTTRALTTPKEVSVKEAVLTHIRQASHARKTSGQQPRNSHQLSQRHILNKLQDEKPTVPDGNVQEIELVVTPPAERKLSNGETKLDLTPSTPRTLTTPEVSQQTLTLPVQMQRSSSISSNQTSKSVGSAKTRSDSLDSLDGSTRIQLPKLTRSSSI